MVLYSVWVNGDTMHGIVVAHHCMECSHSTGWYLDWVEGMKEGESCKGMLPRLQMKLVAWTGPRKQNGPSKWRA